MKWFEDEVLKFCVPLLSSEDYVEVYQEQIRILVGWISLVTVLSEFLNSRLSPTIPIADRDYLKTNSTPPETWSIFVTSLNGMHWRGSWRRRTKKILTVQVTGEFEPDDTFLEKFHKEMSPNTQLSSFGLGNIFFQVFTSPSPHLIADYREFAHKMGLTQIWPIPRPTSSFSSGIWRFPTNLILNDETAEHFALAYMTHVEHLPGIARAVFNNEVLPHGHDA